MIAMIPADWGEKITSTSWMSLPSALTPRSEGVRDFIRLRLDDEVDNGSFTTAGLEADGGTAAEPDRLSR